MKTITIIAEQISEKTLAAALPAQGVRSVTVSRRGADRHGAVEDYRSFRNPNRFAPSYRVDLAVDDDAVDTVFDGISFAYGAGLFSAAEAWVNSPELALSA